MGGDGGGGGKGKGGGGEEEMGFVAGLDLVDEGGVFLGVGFLFEWEVK